MLVTVVLILIFIWLIAKSFIAKIPHGMAPGPWFKIPIFGAAIHLGKNPIESVRKLRKKYGDIFTLNLNSRTNFVFLCDLDTMEEVGKLDNFAFRLDAWKLGLGEIQDWMRGGGIGEHTGIIGSYGKTWREQRRFALRQLKDFGFGRSSMEELVADEVKELIQDMKSKIQENNEMEVHLLFNVPVINSLWKIITGKRLDINNPKDKKTISDLAEMFVSFGPNNAMLPLAMKLPLWLGTKLPLMGFIRGLFGSLYKWFREERDEHEKTRDPDNPRDFLDAYIGELQKAKDENNTESSFYGKTGDLNFCTTMFDLFLAGSETTSTTLSWSILYMLHYPEPFKKARKELDDVVGRSRLPNLEDRPNLPYFEALMSEIMRRANVAPLAVIHSNEKEAMVGNYRVPADSMVAFALTEVLNDPKYFPEPEKLKPERFLETDPDSGNLMYKPHRALVYFGIGKRECLGKNLAKMEFFLFLSALIHQFDFETTTRGLPGPDDCNVAITRTPHSFFAKISARQ